MQFLKLRHNVCFMNEAIKLKVSHAFLYINFYSYIIEFSQTLMKSLAIYLFLFYIKIKETLCLF